MFTIFTCVMSRVTPSEPGLPNVIGIPSMAGGFSFGQVDSTQAMLCLPMANRKEEILSKKEVGLSTKDIFGS